MVSRVCKSSFGRSVPSFDEERSKFAQILVCPQCRQCTERILEVVDDEFTRTPPIEKKRLQDRSIVLVNEKNGSLTTHRLLQLNARDNIMMNVERYERFETIAGAIMEHVKDIALQLCCRNQQVTEIIPHAITSMEHIIQGQLLD